MSVADIMPRIEEAARDELVASLEVLEASMRRGYAASLEDVGTHRQLCSLLMLHAVRCLHDETARGSPLTDAEKWRVFERMFDGYVLARAADSVRALLQIKEASG